jgi:hypothetical protein
MESDNDNFEMGDDEFELTGELDTETRINDYETDEESDYLSEAKEDQDFEDTQDGRYERRLYEIFSNDYQNEFQFENDFNRIMHEVQRDYFWKRIKKWGKKLAPVAKWAIKSIPGAPGIMDTLKQLTKDPRGLLKSLVMQYGPQALNAVVPGAGIALSTVLANNENDEPARQAAKDTIALAKQSYSNFANEISRTNFNRRNLPALRTQLNNIARNSFKQAQRTVRIQTNKCHRYRRIKRRVRNVRNGMYKVVTIIYKRTV